MKNPSELSKRFWDLYFRDAFLTLGRSKVGYRGRTFERPEGAGPPGGLLIDPVRVTIDVPLDELRAYDYAGDPRFAAVARQRVALGEAYKAVVDQTYPYRDAAPFGKQRMAELFTALGPNEPHDVGPLSLAVLEQKTIALVENHIDAWNQLLAALAWFLGERRERSSSKALLAVVDNAPFAPAARRRIHFTPVDAALTALWKVNDKTSLSHLLEFLRNTTDAGKRKVVPLFERLLSTTELLSLERCDDDYFRPEFWARLLEPHRKDTLADWDRYDTDSLFWEIRYLAALRLSKNEVAMFRKLAGDEVQTVRDAAALRLAG